MNAKRAGVLFCAITVFSTAVTLFLGFAPGADQITKPVLLVLSELIMILPCLIAFFLCREPFGQTFGIRKIHPATVPLCIVFTWTLLPLVSCFNIFTQYFTENETTQIMEELSEIPFPLLALFTAVIAPICEEWTFRGILYTGFRKNGSALQAIVITAVLFGLFHMNLNQMLFATILGLFFAVLREVTGSILPSVVCHMTVNGGTTLLQLFEPEELTGMLEESSQQITPQMISDVLSLFIVVAALATPLALGLLIKIAKTEKAVARFENIATGRRTERGKVMGIPLVIGIVICMIFVILDLFWPVIKEMIKQ